MKNIFFIITLISLTFSSFSQESYYDDVEITLSGLELKNALTEKIINTHTKFLVYTPNVWTACKNTDLNSTNSNEVVLLYGWEDGTDSDITNDRTRDKNLQDSGSGERFVWNREHVYPRSLGNPNLGTTGPGSDAHHLRPADRTRNGSLRSNKKFSEGLWNLLASNFQFEIDDIVTHADKTWVCIAKHKKNVSGSEPLNGGSYETYWLLTAALSNSVSVADGWYPGSEWKGDVARMMMYMYLRYDSVCLPSEVGEGNNTDTPDDMIDLFLKWNAEDPVSQMEKGRNTYHENTANEAAQGNRNPFIDNPYLATLIWGGNPAEDLWGIYTSNDSEAPSQPNGIIVSNETTTTLDINWNAATDNTAVTGYNVYIDDVLTSETQSLTVQITGLEPNTSYAIQIEARDLPNNKSEKSTVVTGTTTIDTTPPSVPGNVFASNLSGTGFKVYWDVATDDTAVTSYDVYVDSALAGNTSELSYAVTGLSISSTYLVSISAKDAANNASNQSPSITVSTTDGSTNGIEELFFSEYVEPDRSNNLAIEIVNLTISGVGLSGYSLKKQSNGAGEWSDELLLDSGTVQNIPNDDVFVIINALADNEHLIDNADLSHTGSPMNFSGNDVIGLFRDGLLIDIIGTFDGGSSNFAKDITYRRKETFTIPNVTFNISEWDEYAAGTYEGIGSHSSILSVENNDFDRFKMYPNPNNGNKVYFNTDKNLEVSIYTILGTRIKTVLVTTDKNTMDVSTLTSGVYLIKVASENQFLTKKFIKN